MKEKTVKTSIMLPVSLNESLRRASRRNNHTLTKEITKRLIDSEMAEQAERDFPKLKPG